VKKQPYPITNLTGGLNVNVDAAFLQDSESPDVSEVLYKEGLLTKDKGKIAFGLPLLGTPLLLDTFYKESGTNVNFCFTTTSAYILNTTTKEWEDVTIGVTVEDCEDAWVDKTYVTSSNPTTGFKRGAAYLLLTATADFTTGLMATEVISSANLSGYSHIHLWAKSSIALAAGVLQLMLDDTALCVSPIETINFPALVANTWTRISLKLATPASDTAIISVGVNCTVDQVAFTLALDDIRAVLEYTGTVNNKFFTTVLNDTYISVNGIDPIYKYTTADSMTALAGSPPAYAKTICTFQSRILIGGEKDNPLRIRWSSAGTIETWSGGTSGWIDLDDTVDFVSHIKLLGSACIVYKERTIWEMTYIGGTAVFKPVLRINNQGTPAPSTIVDHGAEHILYSNSSIVTFDGTVCTSIAKNIFPLLFRTGEKIIALDTIEQANAFYDQELQIYLLCFPAESLLMKYNFTTSSWMRYNSKPIYTMGSYKSLTDNPTWTAITGIWSAQVGSWIRLALTAESPTTLLGWSTGQIYEDDRVSSSSSELVYVTKDFIFGHSHRIREVRLLYRYGGVTIYYSIDGGANWVSLSTLTAVTNWTEGVKDIDVTTARIRFKVVTSESEFELKWIEPWYIQRQRSINLQRA